MRQYCLITNQPILFLSTLETDNIKLSMAGKHTTYIYEIGHILQTLAYFSIQVLTLHILFRDFCMKHNRSLLTNRPVFLSVKAP